MVQGRLGIIALVGAAAIASSASAGIVGDAVHISATTADGTTALWSISSVGASWLNGEAGWKISGPIDLRAGNGTLVGRLEGLEVNYVADPVVQMGLVVTAGASSTHFIVTSALLSFAQFNAVARASAAITITDNNGDGASFSGNYAGSKAYRAMLNGGVASGVQFAALVNNQSTGSFSSNISAEASPGGPGYTPVGNTSNMQSEFDFTVSAFDSASATSVFVTAPAPGTIVLGTLGLLGMARRRR